MLKKLLSFQQLGLIFVILILGTVMTIFAGTHTENGHQVNNFLNINTLIQVATDTSFFAIMAVGITTVIVSGGIDLSIGSIYALAGVAMALVFHGKNNGSPWIALAMCAGLGLVLGWLNGVMVSRLKVHPFIITLGTMWVYRGVAFVVSKAESITVPDNIIGFAKANLGLKATLYPVPTIMMLIVGLVGSLFLTKTTWGRRIFAVGGNEDAARYAGLKIKRIFTGVYVIAGLTAGIAAFMGSSFYGAASSADANGYELFVIASAVVGGASLTGGKGSAVGAVLGALVIVMIRQSIRNLHLDQNYESIIIGFAIVIAVVLDRFNAQLAEKRALKAST